MTGRQRGDRGAGGIDPGRRGVAAVLTVAVLVVCAAVLLAGCGSDTSEAPSKEVQTMLEERLAAMNKGQADAVARSYATDAVLDNYAEGGTKVQGAAAIGAYFADVRARFGMQWEDEGRLTQHDKYVVERINNPQLGGPGTGKAIHVLELDSSGKIAHEWIIGWAKA